MCECMRLIEPMQKSTVDFNMGEWLMLGSRKRGLCVSKDKGKTLMEIFTGNKCMSLEQLAEKRYAEVFEQIKSTCDQFPEDPAEAERFVQNVLVSSYLLHNGEDWK